MIAWSDLVLQMLREKRTREEIIAYFDSPVMTNEYIDAVLRSKRLLRNKRPRIDNPWTSVPREGTGLRKVYDYVQSCGGLDAFKDVLKQRTMVSIAEELNIHPNAVARFARDFIRGRSNEEQIRLQKRVQRKKYARSDHKATKKELQDLW